MSKKVFLYILTFANGEIEGYAIADNGDMLDYQFGETKEEAKALLHAKTHSGYEKVWIETDGMEIVTESQEFRQAMQNNRKPEAKQIIKIRI